MYFKPLTHQSPDKRLFILSSQKIFFRKFFPALIGEDPLLVHD